MSSQCYHIGCCLINQIVINIVYNKYMDGFKNPFDELEDDQMINISETNEPTHETSKKTNKQSYARV